MKTPTKLTPTSREGKARDGRSRDARLASLIRLSKGRGKPKAA